ncbi:hypothetical protein [Thermomonas flagellata]|uniref:hypothetical protein n=1 Tax=Thermomonas flagellata TaxID=2888524 RepID=UPI001F03865C|nr:hypothetical protein [Thermomonas flagellata]
MRLLPLLIASSLLAYAGQARADASLSVDDATVTPRGQCQLESWLRERPRLRLAELTSVPACNPRGIEYSLMLSHFPAAAGSNQAGLMLKHVWGDLDAEGRAVAASLAVTRTAGSGHRLGWAFNLPLSVALSSRAGTLLHLNLGWNRPAGSPGKAMGGAGLEQPLGQDWTAFAEAWADHHRWRQLGLRRQFGPRVSVDLMAGRRSGPQPETLFTLGLNLAQSP